MSEKSSLSLMLGRQRQQGGWLLSRGYWAITVISLDQFHGVMGAGLQRSRLPVDPFPFTASFPLLDL